jgi:hypothetical protein
MKKKLVILLVLLFIPFIRVNAHVIPIDTYVDGKPYYSGSALINTWGYDSNTKKYIKTDKSGNVLFKVDNPIDDPISKKGKISISAKVPGTIYDEQIEVVLFNDPYQYSFILNKDNNFKIEQEIIEGTYNINYVSVVNHYDDYQVDYPTSINIFTDKTSTINLDYSKYEKYGNKGKKKNNKRIIIYIFIGIAVVFIIAITVMFYKAKNV